MNCYVCGQPAIGQCQSCWKFYCHPHGEVLCEGCQALRCRQAAEAMDRAAARAGKGDDGERQVTLVVETHHVEAKELERIVPMMQAQIHGATEIELISLECYDDGFILNYRTRIVEEALSEGVVLVSPFPLLAFDVEDDHGRSYNHASGMGAGGHSGGYYRGLASFTPRLPADASHLSIHVPSVRWDAIMPSHKSRSDLGPWEFEVEL
jgi:hypothetical protein